MAIYSTSKAGLSHFLGAMRGEYGKSGVRFTEIEIGNTAGTDAGRDTVVTPEVGAIIQRWTGAPAMLEVGEVVDAIAYALSTPERARIDHIVLREIADIPT
jgi:NAD(P)-dependent dehydrogenase (short-subunit alcohol dehydrogenase family)